MLQICMLLQRRWVFHTHIFNPTAQIYTIITVSSWAPKITVSNSVFEQMWNIDTISPSVPELRHLLFGKWDCRTIWCLGENDLWPYEYKLSLHHCILKDICAKRCHNWRIQFWFMTKDMFCEVTLTFDHQILISPWVQVDVFLRYYIHENGLLLGQRHKNFKC